MGKRKDKQNGQENQDCGKEQNQTKQEENKGAENSYKEVVLKVHMHCEACATKASDSLRGFEGVEKIKAEIEANKVVVSGKIKDPFKVLERVQKKYSRNAELISPIPKPKQDKKEPEKKPQQPQIKSAVLKMLMHCEGCVRDIKKYIEKIPGVLTVEPNMSKSTVLVRGTIDPPKLVETIVKRMGKHAELVKQQAENNNNNNNNNKNDDDEKSNNKNKKEAKEDQNMFHYPPQYSSQHVYPSQIFSDENVHSCSIM